MDLKQEPLDLYEGVIVKTEPDVASGQTEENDRCFTKQEPFKNDHYVLGFGDIDNKCEYQATQYFVNVDEIKQETDECIVHKIEYQPPDFSEKIECDSVYGTIKKEFDVHNAVDVSETKQEVSDSEYIQAKTERELLTTYCDLPTLKSESSEYFDNFVHPCSSKYAGRTLKTLKNTRNVISNKKKLYPCLVCQKNLSSFKSRSKHIDGHFGKSFVVCEFCGKFMSKINFFRHHFIHLVQNRPIKVSQKINVSSTHRHLINHTNKEPFKCDVCFKQFKRKFNLQVHLITHTNEKPFNCDICSKLFNHKSSLRRHLIIHTNEKPFKCEVCFKKFKQNSTLHNHLITHTNGKSFKCDICFKEFKRKSNLQEHLKVIHNDDKPFKCEICSKEFKRAYKLRRHLIIHSDEKPFKCDICSKEFKRNYDLQRHIVAHTSGKTFKCDICAKTYKRKPDLLKHLLIHPGHNRE